MSGTFTCFLLKSIQEPTWTSAAPLPDFKQTNKKKPSRVAYTGTWKLYLHSLRNFLYKISTLWNSFLVFQNQNFRLPTRHWPDGGCPASQGGWWCWGLCCWLPRAQQEGAAGRCSVSRAIGCWTCLLSPTPHRVSVLTPALLLGFWFKPSEHYEEACHLGSFGMRGRDKQGLRLGLQLLGWFGALHACVTQAMAHLLPEVGLGIFFFLRK